MKCTNFGGELFHMKAVDTRDEPQEEQGHIVDLVLATATKKSEIANAIFMMKKRKPTDIAAGPGEIGEGEKDINESSSVKSLALENG